MSSFLANTDFNRLGLNIEIAGLQPEGLYVGSGPMGLEVALFSAKRKPKPDLLEKAWKTRRDNRPTPVLVVVEHPTGIALCGPTGTSPPICSLSDRDQSERICAAALSMPDRQAAIRSLDRALKAVHSRLPGINNAGLFAEHAMASGAPEQDEWKKDWKRATDRAKQALGSSNMDMIKKLGFSIVKADNLTSILSSGEAQTALAVLLHENEQPETASDRFNKLSPITYALAAADRRDLPWVITVQGSDLRLYATDNIGVGRRGRTESYLECVTQLLSNETAGLLWLVFSADALARDGTASKLLEASKRFAGNLAASLRDRIYDIALPKLALGISEARNIPKPEKQDLELTYQMALTVLFRILFVAYAEDRDLLPYKDNEQYRLRSLKEKALHMAALANDQTETDNSTHHWREIMQLWQAVSQGNAEWGVPAYNGTLFSVDPAISAAGAKLNKVALPNDCCVGVLQAILLTKSAEGVFAPIDFRSLSVREFGTIYEGLIESELSYATYNLARDRSGVYRPAGREDSEDDIKVRKGEVFLHGQSGARKSSGSFYTPEFAVEHLLDKALEPALDLHLKRIASLDKKAQAEHFFDFRVADIAMGSGHFLIAAIDRIEKQFSLWLAENDLPGVRQEMDKLRRAANKELDKFKIKVAIEDGQLLRRMIARRCIYGVDLNPLAVMLAKLSIWVHTFVPGLPLSLLDHNLVMGNALVGIGTRKEIHERLAEVFETFPLMRDKIDEMLEQAAEPLLKLAKLTDATMEDVEKGRNLIAEARAKTRQFSALCDMLTAKPVADRAGALKPFRFDDWTKAAPTIHKNAAFVEARRILAPHNAMHFPVAFPEIFLRSREGLSVLLGNPPWEEIMVAEDKFWARHQPGLCGQTPGEQKRSAAALRRARPDLVAQFMQDKQDAKALRDIILSGRFAGMGKGDADLYKAFCWRFLQTASSQDGCFGTVLPRNFCINAGSLAFRNHLFSNARIIDIAMLRNTAAWVFAIHQQFEIALLAKIGSSRSPDVIMRGPFTSRTEFDSGDSDYETNFEGQKVVEWEALPHFPRPATTSSKIFEMMHDHPRLDLKDHREGGGTLACAARPGA